MDTIHIEKRTFPVLDMSCAACAARVDKTLNGQPGVRTASVNYAAATATVEYDTAQCSPEQLKAALQAAGYDLLVGDDRKQLEDRAEQAHDEKYRRLRQRTVWAIILALPVAVIGMFFMHMPYADLISWALSTGWDGISTATPGGNCGTARPTWTLWCRTARSLPTSSAFSTCSFRSSGRHGA